MTRPKADADPWLSDMVAREREVSRTVVYGIRTIIGLLRDIRDSNADEVRTLRRENANLREELIAAYRERGVPAYQPSRRYEPCTVDGCSLPLGHPEKNHRGSLRRVG